MWLRMLRMRASRPVASSITTGTRLGENSMWISSTSRRSPRDRLAGVRTSGRRGGGRRLAELGLAGDPGGGGEAGGADDEGNERQAGDEGEEQHQHGDGGEGRRVAAELAHQRPVGGADEAALGEEHRRGDGDDDGGDLGDEAVADRQDRVGLEGVADRHAVNEDAHGEAHHEVEERDEEAGDGVALHEFRGAVEGAEEGRLLLLDAPALARLGVGDGAGGHVAVDGELLAGHAVEGEAGADLGHAAGALGDDDEVDDEKDGRRPRGRGRPSRP